MSVESVNSNVVIVCESVSECGECRYKSGNSKWECK